ncbi:MAG: NAD(P)/FAD-dependent oxidoreductase [Candidatus Lokiarchaeota archaeon]|nr:NAD(P)/FAD-dependent oxidoreductase [Candidatus Lokiarchaeota archaeon]
MEESSYEYFDVCIVGASIAGNYLSFLLSTSNLRIVVLEDHREIGLPFQCAGIISQKLSQLIKLPKGIVLNQVITAKIVSSSGKFIKLSGDEHPYIVDRVALDRLYYDKNQRNTKVTYYLGEKYKSFEYQIDNDKKYVLIETSKRKIKSNLLVGCDGPLSSVGKQLKVKNDVLYATQIRIKAHFSEDEAAMYFDPQWKQLFGWIVPEGNLIFRIGIAAANNVNECFKRFLEELNIDINNKIDQQGGIIPYGIMNHIAFDNIVLLGDAAGQVKATTGGGIIMLLTAAKYASRCVNLCFKNNNFSKKAIKKYYEKPCSQTIGRELKLHYLIRLILEKFKDKDFVIFFKIIKENRIEHLITLYGDMDFPKALIIKLLRKRTVLSFVLKFLVKNPVIIFKILKLLF